MTNAIGLAVIAVVGGGIIFDSPYQQQAGEVGIFISLGLLIYRLL